MAAARPRLTPEQQFMRAVEDDSYSGWADHKEPENQELLNEDVLEEKERLEIVLRIAVFPEKENLRKAAKAIAEVFADEQIPIDYFKCIIMNSLNANDLGWDGTSSSLKDTKSKDRDQRGKEICIYIARKKDKKSFQYTGEEYKWILLKCWKKLIEKGVKGIGYTLSSLGDLPFPAEFGLAVPFSYVQFLPYSGENLRLNFQTSIDLTQIEGLGPKIKITIEDLKLVGISLENVNAVVQARMSYVPKHQAESASAILEELKEIKKKAEHDPGNLNEILDRFYRFFEDILKNASGQTLKDNLLSFVNDLKQEFLHLEDGKLSINPRLANIENIILVQSKNKTLSPQHIEEIKRLFNLFISGQRDLKKIDHLQNSLHQYPIFNSVFEDTRRFVEMKGEERSRFIKSIRDDAERIQEEIDKLSAPLPVPDEAESAKLAAKIEILRDQRINLPLRDLDRRHQLATQCFQKAVAFNGYSLQLINRRLYMLDAENKKLIQMGLLETAARKTLINLKDKIEELGRGRWRYPAGVKNILAYINRAEDGGLGWIVAALMVSDKCCSRMDINKLYRDEQTSNFYKENREILLRIKQEYERILQQEAAPIAQRAQQGGAAREENKEPPQPK